MENARRWIVCSAGVLGFAGVVLGALGAHALKEALLLRSSLDTWHTAVLYQLVHSVAILALGRGLLTDGKIMIWVARCWIIGTALFCGSLYGLALGGPKILGPITPLGGIAFLTGWALVVIQSLKSPSTTPNA
ncbi:MAG: DUF423 domain-containing protein [Lacunisphaera sp.]